MVNDVPSSITVTERDDADFMIIRRWRGTRRLFGASQAVCMLGFTIVMSALVSLALVVSNKVSVGWPLFIAIALVLYVALVNVVERTAISIRDHSLSIDHGPLPWTRSCRVATEQIATFDARFMRVRAVLRDGTDVTLLSYPRWAEISELEANFISEELGRRLGVPGQAA